MLGRRGIGFVTLMLAGAIGTAAAQPVDPAKYPDLKGGWERPGSAAWDPSKPGGLRQQAPYTPEYEAIFKANLEDQRTGGQAYNSQVQCIPGGVPRVMLAYDPLEILVTPDMVYIRSDHLTENRRIHTDGRDWPATIRPDFHGYSIGRWLDEDGDGRFDALEIETRGMRGPRQLDASGLPLHSDNQTIVKERIHLNEKNPDQLDDEITTIDHAFTRPWTVVRTYKRVRNPRWIEEPCAEGNRYLILGKETYYLSEDGFIMPTRKEQPAPDLKFFEQARQ